MHCCCSARGGMQDWLGFPPLLLALMFLGKLMGNTVLRSPYPLSTFLQADWNFSDDEMGLTLAIAEFAALPAGLLGPLGDKVGNRRLVLSSLVFSGAAALLTLVAHALNHGSSKFVLVAIARFLFNFFYTVCQVSMQAVCMEHANPPGKRGRVTGLLEASWAASGLIGIPLFGALYGESVLAPVGIAANGTAAGVAGVAGAALADATAGTSVLQPVISGPWASWMTPFTFFGVGMCLWAVLLLFAFKALLFSSHVGGGKPATAGIMPPTNEAEGSEGPGGGGQGESTQKSGRSTIRSWSRVFFSRQVLALNLSGCLFSAAHNLVFTGYGFWVAEVWNLDAAEAGMTSFAIGAAELVGVSLLLLPCIDRFGLAKTSIASHIVVIAALAGLAALNATSLAAGLVFLFLLYGPFETLIVANIAFAVEFAHEGAKATVIGAFFQWMFVGRTLGAVLARPAWDLGALPGGIGGMAVACIVGASMVAGSLLAYLLAVRWRSVAQRSWNTASRVKGATVVTATATKGAALGGVAIEEEEGATAAPVSAQLAAPTETVRAPDSTALVPADTEAEDRVEVV